MDLKMEFVTRLKRGERMTDLCSEYGIHRQTGYEVLERFENFGAAGLMPRSRAPKRIRHKTAPEINELLIEAKRAHPTWGPRMLKEVLQRDQGLKLPAPSTIGDILRRAGLTERRKRRRNTPATPTSLRDAAAPNDLWCADYKGQFRLGDTSYCYPLTMTDQHSRFVLTCDGMAAIDEDAACEASENAFRKYGLPAAMRTDNGPPFASTGLANLTRLSVFWLRLEIELERIRPGHPEQNGRHERMHRTLKLETARPPSANLLQQQERFNEFREEFNNVRPHQALEMKRPVEVYRPSERPYPNELLEPDYPLCDDALLVNASGGIRLPGGERYHLSVALARQLVGIRELDDGGWSVTFLSLDLGVIDRQTRTFKPVDPSRRSP